MISELTGFTLVVVFVTLVISITIHEAMHAFTGHWLGDDTAEKEGRISLNPIRHIDPFATLLLPLITLIIFKVPLLAAKPVPFNPNQVRHGEYGAALVGLAGPLSNLVMAIIGAGLIYVLNGEIALGIIQALVIFVQINVAIFVFNMIPIPPLDGSRVLYAFAPDMVQNIMRQLEQFGIVIVFILVLSVPAFTDILFQLNRNLLNILF